MATRLRRDVETGGNIAFVDPRTGSSKTAKPNKDASTSSATAFYLRLGAALVACYLLGVQDLLLAALTSVNCQPSTIRAGSNVTCEITTGALSSEADLSITQTGSAGRIIMLSDVAHAYRVAFSTRLAGQAGVRVSHSIFWSSASVEVIAKPAVLVEIACEPKATPVGSSVRCAVTPRDEYGNAAEVEKPGGQDGDGHYFAVTHVGGAKDLAVHDADVSFVVGGEVGSKAGIAVTLNGRRVEGTVEVT